MTTHRTLLTQRQREVVEGLRLHESTFAPARPGRDFGNCCYCALANKFPVRVPRLRVKTKTDTATWPTRYLCGPCAAALNNYGPIAAALEIDQPPKAKEPPTPPKESKPKPTDEAIADLLREGPPQDTSQVGKHFGLSTGWASRRLKKLAQRGYVQRVSGGAGGTVGFWTACKLRPPAPVEVERPAPPAVVPEADRRLTWEEHKEVILRLLRERPLTMMELTAALKRQTAQISKYLVRLEREGLIQEVEKRTRDGRRWAAVEEAEQQDLAS